MDVLTQIMNCRECLVGEIDGSLQSERSLYESNKNSISGSGHQLAIQIEFKSIGSKLPAFRTLRNLNRIVTYFSEKVEDRTIEAYEER